MKKKHLFKCLALLVLRGSFKGICMVCYTQEGEEGGLGGDFSNKRAMGEIIVIFRS